jgi:parallel beta-helix repeat protein
LAVRTIALVLAALVVAPFAGQATDTARASTGPVSCGDTVTADTVLRTDLTGCTGTALAIGADGVVLDLAGHTVEGAITARGHAGLSVRGGTVRGDVRFDEVRQASVRRLRVRGGSITCVRSAGCTIVQSVVRGGGIAIAQSENGISNRIRRNVVRHAPGAGITADRTDTTSIVGNVVRDSGIGISTSHAADLEVARNVLVRNSGTGLSGSFGSAASFVRNYIASNGGDGISLRTWGGDTLIARNVIRRNRGNGIFGAAVAHWSVIGNLAARNGAAGIAITGAVEDATLANNTVRRNGSLGIDAAVGVIDGGGNRAHANAGAAQCAGIACN